MDRVNGKLDCRPYRGGEEGNPRRLVEAASLAFSNRSNILTIRVCLSKGSTNKEGFLQREIKLVIDKASEMPEDTIFLIPARLEECSVPFQLREFQWVDLFEDSGYARLLQALQTRARALHQRAR